MTASLTRHAPAKLNLALSVGPRGAEGLHPICSWMVTIDLYDDLTLTRLEPDRLSRYAILWHPDARRPQEIDWSITRDLAVRAHLALEQHVGRRLPVQLKLEKRIPVGGGLGGGSTDAAAMLRAVNDLYDLRLDLETLAAIGAELGSDVPFLVRGGSAIVSGTGADLAPHGSVPELCVVLAFPDATCATSAVYAAFDDGEPAPRLRPDAVHALAVPSASPLEAGALFNDLAAAAVRTVPALEDDLRRLSALAERPSGLCGSGSSLFVICDDPPHAEALAAAVERELDLPAAATSAVGIEANGVRAGAS